MANDFVSTTFPGMWNNAENAYGIPQNMIAGLLQPNSLVDLFGWKFDNRPILPQDWLISIQGESGDGSFVEGGCPVEVEWSKTQFTYTAKSLGRCTPRASYVGLAAKQNVHPPMRRIINSEGVEIELEDEWDFQMYTVLKAARRSLEWLTLNGNSTVNPNNFDGLDRIIRAPGAGRLDVNGVGVPDANSIVIDNGNERVTVNLLFEFLGALEANGADPGEIYFITRTGMINEIARLIALDYNDPGAERQDVLRRKTIPLYGEEVPYVTSAWVGSTGTGSTYYTTIYAITPTFGGLPNLYYDFFDMSKLVSNADLFDAPGNVPSYWYMIPWDRGTTLCTSTKFCLWTHGRLVAAAPQVLGKIMNVRYDFRNVRTVDQV